MDNYHITKDGDQWKLKKETAKRATEVANTKKKIIKKTQEYIKTHEGSVKIHKQDGKFQEERTYPKKKDPPESKG